jgi:hypothetical protein
MDDDTPMTLALARGTTRGIACPAGLCLVVLEGRIGVDLPPVWLSGTVHRPRIVLDAGESHLLVNPGWLRLDTDQMAARLALLPPAPGRLARAWAQARRLLGLRPRGLDDLRPLA